MRCLMLALSLTLVSISTLCAQQQQSDTTDRKLVRVGIAFPLNQSPFAVSDKWGRDQIMRNLQALRNDKKSKIVIEPVALGSSEKSAALQDGADKHCDYVVLTRVINFSNSNGVILGPSGVEPAPRMAGNVDARTWMGMDFSIMRPGHPKPIAEGRTAAPAETGTATAQSENSALEDVARQTALRVVHEIRAQAPSID